MENPILKSIIRRPIKFIILILMLSLVSGVFIMNLTSYILVRKEIESAKEAYNSIGYIQVDLSDGNSDGNIYEIRELLKDDPMIAYEDCNIYTLGISDNLLNADYNANTEFFNDKSAGNYLFVRDLFIIVKPEDIRTIIPAKDRYDGVILESHVQALLGGYPDWIYMPDGKMFNDGLIKVVAPKYEINMKDTIDLISYINDIVMDELYELEVGANYLFRCEPVAYAEGGSYLLKPLYDGGPLYEKINNINEFNLDAPKWQKMKDDMELLDINTRTFDMISTKSMETLPYTQESIDMYTLYDGRWINYDDYKNNNKVCVVGKDLFQVRNLKLGDKIPVRYMETEGGFSPYLMTKKDRKGWKGYHKSDVIEYEIVGVYDSYSSGKDIYIPTSTVPEKFMEIPIVDRKPNLWGQNYNFVLKDPTEQAQFIEKYGEVIKEAGFELQFIENNAETFWLSANKVLNNLKTNIALYGLLLLFSMLFIIYMYMEIYKNNYTIERMLGVTHKSASRHILMPLYIFSTLGIGFSSYIGNQTAITNSRGILEEILGELPDKFDIAINLKFVFLIFITIIVILMIQSLLIVSKFKKESLLEFLGKGKKKEGQNLDTVDLDMVDNEFHTDDLTGVLSFDDSNFDISKGKTVLRWYGKKHISRSIITTTLMLVVTGLLIGTLTWLNNVIESNRIFIEKTISETTIFGEIDYIGEVKTSNKGDISEETLNKILETKLVEDYFGYVFNEYNEINIDRYGIKETIKKEGILNLAYYEKNPNMTILASNKEINSDNGIKLSGIEDESVIDEINTYSLNKDEIPILASTIVMDTYNLEIGHKISLGDLKLNNQVIYGTIVGTFEGYVLPSYDTTMVQAIPSTKDEIFIFPIDAVRLIEGSEIYYQKINLLFNKDKNTELYYNREEILNQIAKTKSGINTGYKLVLHDNILTETIGPLEKNLELLSIIYPIILVLSLIIAVVLPYLLILRRSEELAIMRILGVRQVEVKRYVFTESLLLIIVGEVIAMVAISIINSKSGVYSIWKYVFVIFGYLLASIVGILSSLKNVLHKKPLEMLQVKE